MARRVTILFLCTGNSCRSQMAEGFARTLKARVLEAHSAGVLKKGLDPRAVAVMREAGVDISGQRSKTIDELDRRDFDHVVTLCDNARDACPVFPGRARVRHAGFEDPPALAAEAASEEEALSHYRRVRDQIRAFVATLPESLGASAPARNGGEQT
ncbi:MAG: arsenate reductase ArsC [Planctomycetes bacterium]|nr:arsenate reductase ArsC [Planctomycetota bacterium]